MKIVRGLLLCCTHFLIACAHQQVEPPSSDLFSLQEDSQQIFLSTQKSHINPFLPTQAEAAEGSSHSEPTQPDKIEVPADFSGALDSLHDMVINAILVESITHLPITKEEAKEAKKSLQEFRDAMETVPLDARSALVAVLQSRAPDLFSLFPLTYEALLGHPPLVVCEEGKRCGSTCINIDYRCSK